MLASTPTSRPLVLPGTQNLRQRRDIHAYVEHGPVTDPMTAWELDRLARAPAEAIATAIPAAGAQTGASAESDTPWPRLILGAAATVTLWAFIGWALAPYVVLALAWLFGALA